MNKRLSTLLAFTLILTSALPVFAMQATAASASSTTTAGTVSTAAGTSTEDGKEEKKVSKLEQASTGLTIVSTAAAETKTAITDQKSSDIDPLLALFAKRYAPPPEVCAAIEKCKNFIASRSRDSIKYDTKERRMKILPGFYLKGTDISRIINAIRMRNCIQKLKLDCLDVPQKYVYNLNGTWYVVAQIIEPIEKYAEKLSLKEVQQLTTFMEETGFVDTGLGREYDPNIIRDRNNKLVFIDTEDCSFTSHTFLFGDILRDTILSLLPDNKRPPYDFELGWELCKKIPHHCKARYVERLLYSKDAMTQEAYDWLNNHLKDLLVTNKDRYFADTAEAKAAATDQTIMTASQYDDPDINLEEIRNQLLHKSKKRKRSQDDDDTYD